MIPTSFTDWLDARREARKAHQERELYLRVLADALAEDVAGPWVTPADVAEAARRIGDES